MVYNIQIWTLKKLISAYEKGKLALNPPYQRNAIWTLAAQEKLVDTILTGRPMPNFFLLEKGRSDFEVVDGQQRARTIIGYWKGVITDLDHLTLKKRIEIGNHQRDITKHFLEYNICVIVIKDIKPDEHIEEFYALVNSTGLRLNRPELNKAEYYSTRFLSLITSLAAYEPLQRIRLFSSSTTGRMNDIDYVSELVALIKFSISDKKEKVDQLFEDDITAEDEKQFRRVFCAVIDYIAHCDGVIPIRRTRYKQKNDFYTFFCLILGMGEVEIGVVENVYRVMCKLGPHIKPSQADCEPLQRYAYNCVTQSNSKAARVARYDILKELLLNQGKAANGLQVAVLDFLKLAPDSMVKYGRFLTFDWRRMRDVNQPDLFDVEEIE